MKTIVTQSQPHTGLQIIASPSIINDNSNNKGKEIAQSLFDALDFNTLQSMVKELNIILR